MAGRPLVSLTFAINYALGELNVRGYRLVNIAIHVVNALLLFGVVGRAFTADHTDLAPRGVTSYTIAFAIALVWMVHPLVTEPVDYVSQRTELMMATFFLLTLYFGRSRPTVSVICCALGMACKETMVVAPIVVLLYDRTFAFGSLREALQRRGGDYAALCATWLAELGVAATPGIDFDPVRGHRSVRFSFCGADHEIVDAVDRLAGWMRAQR